MSRLAPRDRGSVTTEMVLVVPIAIALLCLVALVGRTTDPGSARRAALESATSTITQSGLRCGSTSVELDTDRFAPGGQVTAHVACEVNLSDLGLLGLPGSRRVTAAATSVLDTYRATR